VLCALGDWNNGFAALVVDGRFSAAVSLFGDPIVVRDEQELEPGNHELVLDYRRAPHGGGPLRLAVDGEVRASATLPRDLPFRWQIGGSGLLIGRDRGFPVCDLYEPPFPFRGRLHEIVLESKVLAPPDAVEQLEAELRHE
jgi:arylsulfatase